MTTPSWDAPQNGGATNTNPNHIHQFLGTHVVTPVYEGGNFSGFTAVTGELAINQATTPWSPSSSVSLASTIYASQFKTASSQTAVERVVVPLTRVGNGADVTVSLYTNNAGVPGTQLGSITIPRDFCVSKSADYFPSYVYAWPGQEIDAQSTLPAALFRFGGAWNGNAVCIFGGGLSTNQAGAALSNVYIGQRSGSNGALQWQTAPSLPAAVEWQGYCAPSGMIVYSGGGSAGASATLNSNVYTATFGTDGSIGSWTLQTTTLPTPIWQHGMATTTIGSTTYVYALGGNPSGTSNGGSTNVWMNTLSTYGTLGASWTAMPPLPANMYHISSSVTVLNGYVVIAGGHTNSLWHAKINNDGTLGAWRSGPTLFNTLHDVGVTTWQDSLIMVGGTDESLNTNTMIGMAQLSPSGIWSREVHYPDFNNPSTAANFNFTAPSIVGSPYFDIYCVATSQTNGQDTHRVGGNVVNLVSVPLKVTGLTASTLYWVAVGSAGGTAIDYTAATYSADLFWDNTNTAGQSGGVKAPWPGGTWTATGHAGVPVTVYGPTSVPQRLMHVVEDSGAKLDWVLSDQTSRLSGYAEATQNAAGGPTVASFVRAVYDVNGQIINTVPII